MSVRSILYAFARGMGDARSQEKYHHREHSDDNRETDVRYLVRHVRLLFEYAVAEMAAPAKLTAIVARKPSSSRINKSRQLRSIMDRHLP